MNSSRRNLLAAVTGAALLPGPRRLEGKDRWDPIVSENLGNTEPSTLRWLAQLGATHVVFQGTYRVDADRKGYWTVDDVRRQKESVEDAGLVLHSMMLPLRSYMQAQLGASGRDREIENTLKTIRAVAEAGVPKMEWRFWPDFYWDERVGYYHTEGRGGAGYRAFDYARVQDQPPFPEIGRVSEEEMWDRFRYFARPVIETAGEVGVQLSIHPNDPPVRNMRGVARIFHHTDAFRKLIEEFPSRTNGITFCQGTITEMGVDVFREIEYFASRGRIQLVHLRGVRGKVPNYVETFIDDGDIDMLAAMKAYRDAGFNGPFVSDHTPEIEGDDSGGRMGRSFSLGYIRALVEAVNAMS